MCYYPILGRYFGLKNMKYKTHGATNNVSMPAQSLNVTWGFCSYRHAKKSHQVQSSGDRKQIGS